MKEGEEEKRVRKSKDEIFFVRTFYDFLEGNLRHFPEKTLKRLIPPKVVFFLREAKWVEALLWTTSKSY